MKAKYVQKGKMIDFKNETSEKISFGDVVVLGTIVAVAADDIEVGKVGAVATENVYEVEKDSSTFTAGAVVYWNTTTGKATSTATSATKMGIAIESSTAAAGTVKVKLNA